jgi:poly-gamma-glutamate capsule biosynthesis protein CapA/YwtB (metallophosphatase superfamily)
MAGSQLRTRRRRRRRLAMVASAALLVGAAVGAGVTIVLDEEDPTLRADADAPGATLDGAGSARAVPDPGPITIAFVGDINVEGPLGVRFESTPGDFVGPFAAVLRGADLAIGNIEAAITTGGVPVEDRPAFRVPPALLDALATAGVDVVSAANDHGIDFGPEGLTETLEVARRSSAPTVVGIGPDEDGAFAPHIASVGGQRVAVIGATQVIEPEDIATWTARSDAPGVASAKRVDRLVAEVEAVRDEADTVVVFVHWGVEGDDCPSTSQQELAAALVEAGADVVVGSHAHRVQGAGRLGEAVVGYGVGDFLHGRPGSDDTEGGALVVRIDGRRVEAYEWIPVRVADGIPEPVTGDDAAETVQEWEARRECAGLRP